MTKVAKDTMRYVSLHHHTTFSYGDGYGTPLKHFERAADLGMDTLAMTEHGNVSSHVQAEKAGKKVGVKPIFGCEVYTGPVDMRETHNMRKWHLTVLAENQTGYVNLNKLVSRSWAEGFYRWPTVTGPMLADHADGLIVLSGCADSLLACTLLGGKSIHLPGCGGDHDKDCDGPPNIRGAIDVIKKFKSLFGDRYYLEVQQFPGLTRACKINTIYEQLSKRTGVPLIASSDCHYPMPDDNDMQKILHAAGRKTGTVAAAEAQWEYDILLTLPLNDAEIHERLEQTGLSPKAATAAIEATREVADRCNVVLPHTDRLRFPLPDGVSSANEMIWRELRNGWKYRWKRNANLRKHPEDYEARLKYEMSVISPKDFDDYFLVIGDGVRWAKDICDPPLPVGPARGSAAGSLVAYMLRIIEVDPMMFPTMMFERFIDEQRADPPDIDLDFADDRRYLIREYYESKYGADHVGNIGNFGRYRGKNAVNAVARTHQVPKYEVKIVNDLVIERSGGDSRFDASLQDTLDMFPQAAGVFERYPALNYAIRLEGNYERMGVHAAGLVISNDPINDTCATYSRNVKGHDIEVIAYDKKDAEYLDMLKADFLGLSTMGMIDIALRYIGMPLDELYQLPLDDKETLAAFTRADVAGVFQFEGRATRMMTMDVQPSTFMEIADINALSRPGPLFSGASAKYVDIKHGRTEPEHLHPIVDKYTAHSKYQIIYQEQVLSTLKEMGGFPGSATGALRKIISLKLGEAQFNEWYGAFIEGAKKHHNVDAELADKIWRFMVTSATYSFNIAHCISYGMLAYWCMWLKVHHPMAFYTAVLQKSDKEKWPVMIRDAEKHGIEVRPPDLAFSSGTWSPDPRGDRAVLAGLGQVPGIGEVTAKAINSWMPTNRKNLQWHQLSEIKGIGTKTCEKIEKWVNSEDPFNLYYAQRVLGELREAIAKKRLRLPRATHKSDEIPRDEDWVNVIWMGIPKKREYKDYMEDERARSGKEPEVILAEMDKPDLLKSCVLKCYDDGEEDVYLRFNRFRFPIFRDQLESIKLDGTNVVIATGVKRKSFGLTMQVKSLIVLDVTEEEEGEDDYLG